MKQHVHDRHFYPDIDLVHAGGRLNLLKYVENVISCF